LSIAVFVNKNDTAIFDDERDIIIMEIIFTNQRTILSLTFSQSAYVHRFSFSRLSSQIKGGQNFER